MKISIKSSEITLNNDCFNLISLVVILDHDKCKHLHIWLHLLFAVFLLRFFLLINELPLSVFLSTVTRITHGLHTKLNHHRTWSLRLSVNKGAKTKCLRFQALH